MSIGRIDEIQYYFNENYTGYFEKFSLYNLSHEFYRGYATEVYTVSKEKYRSLLSPVIHVFRIPPTKMRWFGV